jgi:VWFA-related protein
MPNIRPGLTTGLFAAALLFTMADRSAPITHAQQPPPQAPSSPVFRGGTTFVSVDAYPRRDGKLVEGLIARDFRILEDGMPQTVETFQFIRIEPNPADNERRDPNTKADGDRQAADPRNRVFVVYLDLRHTTVAGSHYARQPVLDFLTRTIGAHDLFGVLTQEVPVRDLVFVRRTETLEAELTKYWPWGQLNRSGSEVRTPLEERLAVCEALMPPGRPGAPLVELSRDDLLMTSLEHLIRRLGDLRDERKNVLFVSEGWVPRGPRPELLNVTVSDGDIPGVGVGPGGRLGIGQTMQPHMQDRAWCDSEIARLASIDFEARFRQLLTSAIQVNVSFYPIDVGGLRTSATRATDTLRTMAENTDGFAIVSTNDLVGGVRRIEDDLSAFYLLGYYSTNEAANGRFRQIEVTVNQPGVRVSARRGYLAPTAEMLAAASAPRVDTGPSAVDGALAGLAAARDDTELFVAGAATPGGLYVAMELATAVAREAFSKGAELRAVATRSDGASASASATLAAGDRIASTTIAVPQRDATGTWQVTVQAAGADRRLERRLEIVARSTRLIGPALASRATSLSSRAPLQPLVDPRLSRRERLRVEWPVVAAADRHEARLLDRAGRPLGQALPITAPTADRPTVILDLPLAALPEGDYVVEFTAMQGDVSERELLAFRVVR